jgi:ribosomal protein S18 acetylase RimI-like enzyme
VNTVSFPVSYNEGFYQDVVKRNNEHLNKFAYYNGFVVGAVCTRIEPIKCETNPENAENAPHNNANGGTTTSSSGSAHTKQRLYIMTLAVLAAYRGRGIGAQLIQSVVDYCDTINHAGAKDEGGNNHNNNNATTTSTPTKQQHQHHPGMPKRIDEIALHVQISNEDAIRFYTTKFGFQKGEMVENYYRRIDPPHCYILSKKL